MSVPLRLDERWVECLSQVKVDSPMFRGFLALRVDGRVDGMGGGKETRIREGTQGNPPALMSPFPHCLGKQVWRVGEGERAASALALWSSCTVFTHVAINQCRVCHFN